MQHALKLGKPTRQGCRHSAGYHLHNGKTLQRVFLLGHDRETAFEKLIAIHGIGTTILPDADGRLVWDVPLVGEVKRKFAVLAVRTNSSVPSTSAGTAALLAPAHAGLPVFAAAPLPARPRLRGLLLHDALDQYVAWWQARNDVAPKTKLMERQKVRSLKPHLPNRRLAEVVTTTCSSSGTSLPRGRQPAGWENRRQRRRGSTSPQVRLG